jgi:formylglycine-generating enzyme required for sulfatase activity
LPKFLIGAVVGAFAALIIATPGSQAEPHSSAKSVLAVSPPAATLRSPPPPTAQATSDTPQLSPSGTPHTEGKVVMTVVPLTPPAANPAAPPAPSPLLIHQPQAADITPPLSKTHADEQIASLLGRVETLLDEGHVVSPAGGNATDVFTRALVLSSTASPAGLRMMAEFPSALKRRADAERAAGHVDLSVRLEVFAEVVSSVVGSHDTSARADAAPSIQSGDATATAGAANPATRKAAPADQAAPVSGGTSRGDVGTSPSKAITDTRSPLPAPPIPSQSVAQYVPPPARETGPPASSGGRPNVENPKGFGGVMVFLPGGRFQMGSHEDRSEQPAHFVQIRPFWIGKYPVTVGEWRACVAAGGCEHIPDSTHEPDQPMSNVSWLDAMSYVKWLARASGLPYRLPSEAEWEYAARAGSTTRYWWGNEVGLGHADCHGCGSSHENAGPLKVGSFAPNRLGLFDMGGGVAEWVADCWHAKYAGAPTNGAAWECQNGGDHVLRGGSWMSAPGILRASDREHYETSVRYPGNGFRVARSE